MTHSHEDPQCETNSGFGLPKTGPSNRLIDWQQEASPSCESGLAVDPSFDLLQMSNSITREFTAKLTYNVKQTFGKIVAASQGLHELKQS